MSKSKFHVFAENLKIDLSFKNDFKQWIKLYNCMVKLLHIFRVEKNSIVFEEDTFFIFQTPFSYINIYKVDKKPKYFPGLLNSYGIEYALYGCCYGTIIKYKA